MAFKKTLVQRLFNLSRFSTPSISRNSAVKPPSEPPEPSRIKRNMQRRPFYQSASTSPANPGLRLFPPTGQTLVEKLQEMNVAKDRIRLSGLIPLPQAPPPAREDVEEEALKGLSAREVRKVLRASQVEMIKEKLGEIGRDWVEYKEYMEIIEESCGGNKEQALTFAKTLDDCGSVIVLGNAVCLRPQQVAKAIQSIVTPSVADTNDPRMQELELLEEQKAEIDRKAEGLVRRELWAGLGYMVVQTAAFMRLTFWELSWDVMEPICFYVTSAYFMLGYTFFLRTSKEPSFEGFFQSRFNAKQKRLIKSHNFDLERMSSSSFQSAQPFRTHCDCGIPVAKLQSWTSKNPGRRFAICKFRNIERGLRGCGYWEWIDENMVEWQRCLINQLLLEKKLLEKEKEVLKAELCNVQDQKTNLVRDLDTIRVKVKHLAAEKKLKVKKKHGSGCSSMWWVLVAAFVIVAIFVLAVVGM